MVSCIEDLKRGKKGGEVREGKSLCNIYVDAVYIKTTIQYRVHNIYIMKIKILFTILQVFSKKVNLMAL